MSRLLLCLLLVLPGCATQVERKGEYVFLVCAFACILRVSDGTGQIDVSRRRE